MTTTSLSKRELYLKLRGDSKRDPFIDSDDIFKTPFVFYSPSFNGHIYKLLVKPMPESHISSCYIEDIPIAVNESCYILAPASWTVIGLALDHSDGRSRYTVPFTELS